MRGRRHPVGSSPRTRSTPDAANSAVESPTIEETHLSSRLSSDNLSIIEKSSAATESPAVDKATTRRSTRKRANASSTSPPTGHPEESHPEHNSTGAVPGIASNSPEPPPDSGTESTPRRNPSRRLRANTKEDLSNSDHPVASPAQESDTNTNMDLVAIDEAGKETLVKIFFNGSPFRSSSRSPGTPDSATKPTTTLGNDGNLYYCFVCGEFGDVVCCDGCPRVYHPGCIPVGDPSRVSLDNDDDPWYCPDCIRNKPVASSPNRSGKTDKRHTSQHRCVDCQQDIGGLAVEPCSECGNYTHHPSCTGEAVGESERVLCVTCRAVEDLTQEEDDVREGTERSLVEVTETLTRTRRKRSRAESVAHDAKPQSERKKKKKKKRSKTELDARSSGHEQRSREGQIDDEAYHRYLRSPGPVQSIPGFYFYLAENRWKIERILARKHRFFNRLPKGSERNELVATEAALWWVKLRPTDHRRYMTMSMRDFEARIIEWKEEKNIRDMVSGESELEESGLAMLEDPLLREEESRSQERYLQGTSVGSKPFKAETDHTYNRVLSDLLQDMRFSRSPMIDVNRKPIEHDRNRAVPYFEVHGPVSTSIGDECLGCCRGWRHFCPVLKRQIPAVDNRARLQPPLSSLMATRVGLGLRPRLDITEQKGESESIDTNDAPLFSVRLSGEAEEVRNLPVFPSASLSGPSERMDEIALVIDQATTMKVSGPSGNSVSGKNSAYSTAQGVSPVSNGGNGSSESWFRCGRCRTISESELGCIQCRRAQFVINLTKRGLSDHGQKNGDSKNLKMHTVMLGRAHMKESVGDLPSSGDQAVSDAILKQRWIPMTVLPTNNSTSPTKSVDFDVDEGVTENVAVSEDIDGLAPMDLDDELKKTTDALTTSSQPSEQETEARTDRSRTRHKPTRLLVSSSSTRDYSAVDKNFQHLKQLKLDDFNHRSVSVACLGVYAAVARRDPQNVMNKLIQDGDEESQTDAIDFAAIKGKVLSKRYETIDEIVSDIKAVCSLTLSSHSEDSLLYRTAKDIQDHLGSCEAKAKEWFSFLKGNFERFLSEKVSNGDSPDNLDDDDRLQVDETKFYEEMRAQWPEAIAILEHEQDLRHTVEADFARTKENEIAYYGALAIRRVACAAATSLAPATDRGGEHGVVVKRDYIHDEELRRSIDESVANIRIPVQLSQVSSWREEAALHLLRAVQRRRVEHVVVSQRGCARCTEFTSTNSIDRKEKDIAHTNEKVDVSRRYLTTGLGSAKTCQAIVKRSTDSAEEPAGSHEACLSVQGSKIHGMGLFADQPFKEGEVIVEYVGEHVDGDEMKRREDIYHKQRMNDYFFRLDDNSAIDATAKGNEARFINHSCDPNSIPNVIVDEDDNSPISAKKVMIIAKRDIEINEEITYDYQVPLEMDLSARLPCNCHADVCRGFMNWDFPEAGSNNRALLVRKRGANIRDRIRRLRRPLKSEL